MERSGIGTVFRDRRANAALSWLFVAFLAATVLGGLVGGNLAWAVFTAVVVALIAVPPVAFRSATATLPWEVVGLASLPAVTRLVVVGERVGGVTLTGRVTTYLAVAAVALIVAVELDAFTAVKMNEPFAVAFVAVTTMAAAGLWTLSQWLSDGYLGTRFLAARGSPAAVETALMWDFVAATVAGVGAGVLFELYFRRVGGVERRLPDAVAADPGTQPAGDDETGGDRS